MTNSIDEWTNAIHEGDSLEEIPELPANSVHAVVTDPPYGLAFMGRNWDDFSPKEYQEWCENWARECLRVLKPGGHFLAFSGDRTHHRLFSGVEDAGFTVRDTITWHYGSGFPKTLDVSKAIDKQAGAERKVVGKKGTHRDGTPSSQERSERVKQAPREATEVTAPATDAAEQWEGFKTALKPATEFVVLARKPLAEDTVAENVQAHGTGALNIDGCRVDTDEDLNFTQNWGFTEEKGWNQNSVPERGGEASQHEEGRYPANVVFDERQAGDLDDAEGETGGPSRYFYTSKATKSERTMDGKIENSHPTVKPTDLMEWLVKLVTAEDQIVLDPFAGSGTTCLAAKNKSRRFVGIEMQKEWADVARVRCGLTPDCPGNVRADDDNQQGLEVYTDGGR